MKAAFFVLLLAACNEGTIGDTSDTSDTDTGGKDTDMEGHDTDECDLGDTSLPATDGLPDLLPLAPSNVVLTERVVTEADCAWVEKCVGGLGKRRLLRFDQHIANVGDDDLVFGDPDARPSLFEYSLCHGHHHFTGFAAYDLRDDDGNVVATGHKQAFCLLDSDRYLDDDDVSRFPRYTCENQGIQRGWSDVYGGYLDCQWVDVTDLAPGTYTLHIAIDPGGHIPETQDGNNESSVTVTIPEPDITRTCGFGESIGVDRDCGWHQTAQGTCAEGERVTVGCFDSGECGDAGCSGNPVLRICEGTNADCLSGGAWARDDDACGTDCPEASFLCPPSGAWTAWTAQWMSSSEPSCTVSSHNDAMPDPTVPCAGNAEGLQRECGWTPAGQGTCAPGELVWSGCDPYACGLDVCPGDPVPDVMNDIACNGDPILRACPGSEPCHAREALALGDDACGQLCPATYFTCPPEGSFNLLTGAYESNDDSVCEIASVPASLLMVPDAP